MPTEECCRCAAAARCTAVAAAAAAAAVHGVPDGKPISSVR